MGVAAVLAVALAVLLLTPVRLSAAVQTAPELTYKVDVRILGRWTPRIPLLDSAKSKTVEGPSREKWALHRAKQPTGAKTLSVKKRRFNRASGARMVRALPQLLTEVAHSIRWESFHLDAEFGLDDPAETGQVYGCVTSLQYGAPWPPSVSIALRPNFERTCLNGELQATLYLRLAALLAPAVRFAWRVFGPGP